MAYLRLFNTTSKRHHKVSERNVCSVNGSLQLINSVPDIRRYFVEEQFRTDNDDDSQQFPICDQISEIFKASTDVVSSAGKVRELVANSRPEYAYLNRGDHQDLTVFLMIMLDLINKEMIDSTGQLSLHQTNNDPILKLFSHPQQGRNLI